MDGDGVDRVTAADALRAADVALAWAGGDLAAIRERWDDHGPNEAALRLCSEVHIPAAAPGPARHRPGEHPRVRRCGVTTLRLVPPLPPEPCKAGHLFRVVGNVRACQHPLCPVTVPYPAVSA